MALLELENIHAYYGGIHALKGVSLKVEEGEIVTLIGSNGAGKTTALKAISALLKIKEGKIIFNGKRLDTVPPHEVAKLGVGHVPEGRKIFPRMTVLENLEMGAFAVNDKQKFKDDLDKVLTLFPRLKERVQQKGGTLSGGEQQMLAIGRAIMMRPQIMLLDEPSMGLAPIIVDQIFHIIQELNKQGTTILLVEQNANQALQIAHRGYVIQTGSIILHDTGANLLLNEMVKEAYLGAD